MEVDMRGGMATALAVMFCVSGCGERADPGPAATDSPTPEPNGAAAASAAPAEVASPAEDAVPTEAAKAPPVKVAVPVRLRALGTEPFWNAQISGGMLTYTTPEDQQGQRAALTRRDSANGAEFSGKLGGSAIHLAVTKQSCSDGMSDRRYPFTVVLTLGSDRRDGCAS